MPILPSSNAGRAVPNLINVSSSNCIFNIIGSLDVCVTVTFVYLRVVVVEPVVFSFYLRNAIRLVLTIVEKNVY